MDEKAKGDADAIRAWLDSNEPDDGVHPVRAKALAALRVMVDTCEIATKGIGAFSIDPLQHAENVIEETKEESRNALSHVRALVEGQ